MSKPMDPRARIYVAGHQGMVGSALVRILKRRGCDHLILKPLKLSFHSS